MSPLGWPVQSCVPQASPALAPLDEQPSPRGQAIDPGPPQTNGAEDGSTQPLPEQVKPGGHVRPQPPQFLLSLEVVQAPPQQTPVKGPLLPLAVQTSPSWRLAHDAWQSPSMQVLPVEQSLAPTQAAVQAPCTQPASAGQPCPQALQLEEFDERSVHDPAQHTPCPPPLPARTHCVPEAENRQLCGVTQTPARQTWVLPHRTPQPPQFWGSERKSFTQVVPQQAPPLPQLVPSWPPAQVGLTQPTPQPRVELTCTPPAGQVPPQSPMQEPLGQVLPLGQAKPHAPQLSASPPSMASQVPLQQNPPPPHGVLSGTPEHSEHT
jgi:hypothetical protein